MIKVLAVIVNYSDEQLDYLDRVVTGLKSFKKYEVDIVVHSNIPIENNVIDEVKTFKLDDYQLLPLTCRQRIWDERANYDLFIYGENDHLFEEHHLDLHLSYTAIFPKNRIPGLMQYEYNELGNYYPAYHHDFDWDYASVEIYKGKVFAHFNNVHQATFILTPEQLLRVGEKIKFTELVDERPSFVMKGINKAKRALSIPTQRRNIYSVKCKVNTDIYLYGGMKKMICISDFEDNLIHHLPNLYIDGLRGRTKLRADSNKMNKALDSLLTKTS